MAGSLPPSAAALVRDQVRYVISADRGALGVGLVLALLAALYRASRATDALIVGVNIAYDEHETRSSLKRRLLAVAVTAGVVVAVGLAFALIVGLEHGARQLVAVLRWPVLALVAVVGLLLLYRHAPCRRPAKWRWLSVGTVVASALWLSGTGVFSAVVTRFSTLSETYGALAGVIVLMLWLLLTAFAILLGAEVNSELEHQTCVDTTVGDELPVGTRGAAKADLLGPRFELRLPWRRRDDEGPESDGRPGGGRFPSRRRNASPYRGPSQTEDPHAA